MEDIALNVDWASRDIATILWGVVVGLIILVVGRWLARWISRLAARSMERAHVDETVVKFLRTLIYAGLLVAVVIAALNTAGIQTTSFTALLATMGIAVGLAVKDSLSNFASGLMILLTNPFVVDDVVEIGGASGTVEEVSILTTVLRTVDNVKVIVPNANITSNNIRNFTANDTRRVDLVAGIGYGDNIGQARDVLMAIMREHPLVLAQPAPTVDVLELADNSVNLTVRPWVQTKDYYRVRADVLEQIKLRFDEAGISMPYPQYEVTLLQSPAGA